MARPNKVLITSVKAGAGHVKAAEALQKPFSVRYPDVIVNNVDLLDYPGYTERLLTLLLALYTKPPLCSRKGWLSRQEVTGMRLQIYVTGHGRLSSLTSAR